MPPKRKVLAAITFGAIIATTFGPVSPTAAVPPTATYTITVGSKATYAHPTDTPAHPYIDKDGTFYFQQSAALYGATQPRYWNFFTGTNFDDATRSSAISDAVNPNNSSDRNNNTTWRCNNSPTGVESTFAPAGSGYSQKNFCGLIGLWVDPDTGAWYGLVHNEFTPQPFGDGLHYDAIDYAVSTDQGRTWAIRGHAITSPYSTLRGDTAAFPQQTYHYGDGDQRLFVDAASGYFYVYYGSRLVDKGGSWRAFYAHVARAPMSSKLATGSWQKWYNGSWSQPGVGGKESNLVPVNASSSTGYTPPDKEYNPANTGTVSQQVAAGKTPPTSPLFVMNIAYNAYLGLYIGTPQAVDQSGNAPQEIYVTDDLATSKWYLAGNTGSYRNASWYRWFLDSANKTSSTIVGKSFRSYCAFGCSGGASGEYVNLTIGSTAPAAPPVDLSKTYHISSGAGRVLAQVSGSTATTSVPTASGSALHAWSFASNSDGSYRITNASTGQALGVDSATTASRAWAVKPTAATISGSPTVGQQWWIIKNTGSSTYRIVNRHSGLVLGLSADSTRLAETTPARHWTNSTGNPVGGNRSAAEQTLTFAVAGTPGNLNGTHTLTASGKALDNPNHSTTPGTQLITWSPNGGSNQNWVFTQQADGSYQIVNGLSQLCMDVSGGSTSPGARIVQWTCTGSSNQRWIVTAASGGGYTVAAQHSGLLLTTASTSDGALVTQQANSGSALQRWSLS
ncbi:RICIN domain-containing protein [Catelliglobosispora koreensis]|uniref:RICIN domain-containing protein n=1 Tax=Catelliglobosispora koreensis TaxID=129052 RepID=UPI0003A0AB6B|nr:RICIN domain-containing protein [Catelliglobosispora koreensis]